MTKTFWVAHRKKGSFKKVISKVLMTDSMTSVIETLDLTFWSLKHADKVADSLNRAAEIFEVLD